MSIYSRRLLAIFVANLLWIFTLLQIFLTLAGILALLATHPYATLAQVLWILPDVLLVSLPVSLPFAVMVAGILYSRTVHRCDALLWMQLCGRNPLLGQLPILLIGCGMLVMMGWLGANVIPHAQFGARYDPAEIVQDMRAMAIRVARKPRFLPGYRTRFGRLEGDALTDFRLTSRDAEGTLAMTSQRAQLASDDDGRLLSLLLEQGRYLRIDHAQGLSQNIAFDSLELQFDIQNLTRPSKRNILSLNYYTNAELEQLRSQAKFLLQRGYRLSSRRLQRLEAIELTRALRWSSAALPLLSLLLITCMLAGAGHRQRWRLWVVVFAVLVLLFQQTMIEVRVAKSGSMTSPIIAWIPAGEIGLAFLLGWTWRRARRKWQ